MPVCQIFFKVLQISHSIEKCQIMMLVLNTWLGINWLLIREPAYILVFHFAEKANKAISCPFVTGTPLSDCTSSD